MSFCGCQHKDALKKIVAVASAYPAIENEAQLAAMAAQMNRIAEESLGIDRDVAKKPVRKENPK